jgi:hypothetical protein
MKKKSVRTDAQKVDTNLSRQIRNISLEQAFARMDEIRKRAKLLPKGMTIKDLIEEGRR